MSKNFMLDPSNPDFVQQVRQQEAQQLYHQYHFVQQQQHFQYLQNALAKSMNQSPKSPSEQQPQQQQQHLQPPYFPTAVFKPNYMQDVLLNESCVLSSPVNSMDSSNCTTTKTTPIMAPINISKHDQLSSISPHGHYHHHEDDDIELFPSSKDGALPSPSSPLIDCSLAKPHEEYLHLVSSLSSTNDMLDTKSNHFCFGYGSPKQTTTNYDFVSPSYSPVAGKKLFDNSSKMPVIPSSPTFPVALSIPHGKVHPNKMSSTTAAVGTSSSSVGSTSGSALMSTLSLQPPFETKKITENDFVVNKLSSSKPGSRKSSLTTTSSVKVPYVSMKKRLLAKYSPRLLQRMRLSESDTKCRKHCHENFRSYSQLIDHYESNGLECYLQSRSFICPVKECPMNIIGFDKRADLRHHVHSDHVTHGLVSDQYSKYAKEIQEFLFVCDEPDCGKGFYRSDTLSRHMKLVHKRQKINPNPRRKRKVDDDEDVVIDGRSFKRSKSLT